MKKSSTNLKPFISNPTPVEVRTFLIAQEISYQIRKWPTGDLFWDFEDGRSRRIRTDHFNLVESQGLWPLAWELANETRT